MTMLEGALKKHRMNLKKKNHKANAGKLFISFEAVG
jgi:hypothetical protein